MVVIEIKQYRTLPSIRFSLRANGITFDLTNKVLNFVLGRKSTGEVLIRRACTVIGSPAEGRCDFHWLPGDTDFSELNLDAELELVLSDGRTQTISEMKVNITPSLGGG
jgi:hypothetical protein